MIQRILFITSTNLASNPRCRKEIGLAIELGIKVDYFAFHLTNWTKEKENEIQRELKGVSATYIHAGRKNFISWLISSAAERLLRRLPFLIKSTAIVSIAVSRRSLQLLWSLRNIATTPDLIIAHNPGAFYPAYYLSKKLRVPFAVDVEDYHPGEGNNKVLANLSLRLQKVILPEAIYVSFAAPIIREKTICSLDEAGLKKDFVINNVFPGKEFKIPEKRGSADKLRVVWFSQNIDHSRGLEEIIPVIDKLKNNYELTLIGSINEDFYKTYIKGRSYIRIIKSLGQRELHHKLSEFDIGLALETTSADENRNICLTNKIWAYLQAGLFIIASDTQAQSKFIQQFPEHGILTNVSNQDTLFRTLYDVCKDAEKLLIRRSFRFEKAINFSFENESEKLQIEWLAMPQVNK